MDNPCLLHLQAEPPFLQRLGSPEYRPGVREVSRLLQPEYSVVIRKMASEIYLMM